jgi:hypothetical protein
MRGAGLAGEFNENTSIKLLPVELGGHVPPTFLLVERGGREGHALAHDPLVQGLVGFVGNHLYTLSAAELPHRHVKARAILARDAQNDFGASRHDGMTGAVKMANVILLKHDLDLDLPTHSLDLNTCTCKALVIRKAWFRLAHEKNAIPIVSHVAHLCHEISEVQRGLLLQTADVPERHSTQSLGQTADTRHSTRLFSPLL